MRWKGIKETVALFKSLFGTEELPIDAENKQLNLSAEQRQKIVDALGEARAEKAINGINSEIKAMADENIILKAAQDELDALVLESGLTAEELANAANDGNGNDNVLAIVKTIAAKNKEMASIIERLSLDPEGDKPLEVIRGGQSKMQHSATHLFGTGKTYDAFEGGRSWNARLRDGGMKATDFNTNGTIPLLQSDMEHFVEENSGVLESLFNDFRGLPKEWAIRTGVLDRVSDGSIIAGEIVQGRAAGWSPKNEFKISSEQGRTYRKKIDITFTGYELQEIENTWIRQYNKTDGSHPWKMSFIGFLLGELIKQQMVDDRNAQINGIWVESPGGDNMPGAAVNSQNGLLYLWQYYRDVAKKYRAFDIGAPTESNIVDYINTMIEMIPEIERKEQGLEIQMSTKWHQAYLKRAGQIRPELVNSVQIQGRTLYQNTSPLDYPNIILQPLEDLTKTDFIGITYSKNVQILEYNASEKGKFTVTHEKRDTHVFADYRLGIRFIMIGTKLEAGDPRSFEVQKVWSNNMPVFGNDVFAPAFDDTSGILKVFFNNIEVHETWKTNITSIEGANKGSVLRIKGNKGMAATKNLVKNANLDLASNFDLSTGATIVLFANENGTFKELSRTNGPDVVTSTDIEFKTGILDSKGGNVFMYTGAASVTLTSILNGVEGKTIKIFGSDAVNVDLTIDKVATINVASTAVLEDSNDYLQLTFVDGVWIETAKSITV